MSFWYESAACSAGTWPRRPAVDVGGDHHPVARGDHDVFLDHHAVPGLTQLVRRVVLVSIVPTISKTNDEVQAEEAAGCLVPMDDAAQFLCVQPE